MNEHDFAHSVISEALLGAMGDESRDNVRPSGAISFTIDKGGVKYYLNISMTGETTTLIARWPDGSSVSRTKEVKTIEQFRDLYRDFRLAAL